MILGPFPQAGSAPGVLRIEPALRSRPCGLGRLAFRWRSSAPLGNTTHQLRSCVVQSQRHKVQRHGCAVALAGAGPVRLALRRGAGNRFCCRSPSL